MPETKLYTAEDINRAIRKQVEMGEVAPVGVLKGHDTIAVGMPAGAIIRVTGNAGDFFGALNDGGTITLNGDAGRFAGDTMTAGELVLNGVAMWGVGQYLRGGIIVVKGDCKGPAGQLMKAGTIIIDGSAGREVGKYMMGGQVIINGNTGERTGENMSGGAIFVKGEVRSLGLNARISKPSGDDMDRLRYLHKQYRFRSIQDDEAFGEFKKVTAESNRPLVGEGPK